MSWHENAFSLFYIQLVRYSYIAQGFLSVRLHFHLSINLLYVLWTRTDDVFIFGGIHWNPNTGLTVILSIHNGFQNTNVLWTSYLQAPVQKHDVIASTISAHGTGHAWHTNCCFILETFLLWTQLIKYETVSCDLWNCVVNTYCVLYYSIIIWTCDANWERHYTLWNNYKVYSVMQRAEIWWASIITYRITSPIQNLGVIQAQTTCLESAGPY